MNRRGELAIAFAASCLVPVHPKPKQTKSGVYCRSLGVDLYQPSLWHRGGAVCEHYRPAEWTNIIAPAISRNAEFK